MLIVKDYQKHFLNRNADIGPKGLPTTSQNDSIFRCDLLACQLVYQHDIDDDKI